VAAVLADDAHGVVEAESEALAGALVVKKGLEDALLQLGWNAGPVSQISTIAFQLRADRPGARALGCEGVERVFNQRGPDLIELASVGVDGGKAGLIVALDLNVVMRDWSIWTVASRPAGTSTSRMGARSMPEYALMASMRSKMRAVEWASVSTEREARR